MDNRPEKIDLNRQWAKRLGLSETVTFSLQIFGKKDSISYSSHIRACHDIRQVEVLQTRLSFRSPEKAKQDGVKGRRSTKTLVIRGNPNLGNDQNCHPSPFKENNISISYYYTRGTQHIPSR